MARRKQRPCSSGSGARPALVRREVDRPVVARRARILGMARGRARTIADWCCGAVPAPLCRQVPRWASAWETIGCPYHQGFALADDDDEEALRSALEIFQALGARPAARLVVARLRAMGARTIPRGPRPRTRDNPAGLTSRELEVLTLLGHGLRNVDIAERLVVSPKTVDHHVSAILRKLGVPNRVAAAEEAVRLGLEDREVFPAT